MAHWTPPNRGVTSALTAIPTTSSFPLMGTEMRHATAASTDGGTPVSRSGMSKSGNPTAGGKGLRRNILAERGGPCGAVQVMRRYDPYPATGGSVYTVPSVSGASGEFRAAAGRA
ncbi:hypothetical protein [Streptomyces sp. CBMA29]|uniref:hypothetical protein n=1 Tax=Streptomyces sp. CBMA29 TaxID=1896314 RepID=UPI00166216A9|nr:hypothetical protein [Streptomyces sp. CBMA29]MBD0734100.1 hypothetical protein [Streptomyces sp. CBMA29]